MLEKWKRAVDNEKVFGILLTDFSKAFDKDLLDKNKDVTIYVKNVRALAVEMFKVSNNYSISLMSELFDKRNNVSDFRNPSEFARRNVRSVFNGTENISILGPIFGIVYLVN